MAKTNAEGVSKPAEQPAPIHVDDQTGHPERKRRKNNPNKEGKEEREELKEKVRVFMEHHYNTPGCHTSIYNQKIPPEKLLYTVDIYHFFAMTVRDYRIHWDRFEKMAQKWCRNVKRSESELQLIFHNTHMKFRCVAHCKSKESKLFHAYKKVGVFLLADNLMMNCLTLSVCLSIET